MTKPRDPAPIVPVGLEKILFLASREQGFLEEFCASRFETIERRGIRLTEAEKMMLDVVSDDQLVAMASNLDSSERALKRRGLMRAVATVAVTLAAGTGAGCGGADRQAWDSVKLPPEACANDHDPSWGSRPHTSECEDPEEPKDQEGESKDID